MSTPKLSSLRAQIAEKQAELELVELAGRPVADTLPRVAELLYHLAEPYWRGIGNAARQVIAARGEVSLNSSFNLTFAATDFAVGAVAALLRERILGDIDAEVKRQVDLAPQALADDAQRLELLRLRSELRSMERDEEDLLVAEAAAGNHIERRPDADPVCVLGVPDGIAEEFGL